MAIASGYWTATLIGLVPVMLLWILAPRFAPMLRLETSTALGAMRITALGAIPAILVGVAAGALQGMRRFDRAAVLTGDERRYRDRRRGRGGDGIRHAGRARVAGRCA